MNRDLATLPFDQYGRYAIVRDALGAVRPLVGEQLKILDVGGFFRTRRGVEMLPARAFLPDDDVTVLDMPASTLPGYVQGDGRGLAFADQQFDFVVSCDTLEHIPADDRPAFWNELLRVATNGVLLIAPFDTPGVAEAERLVYDYIEAELGQQQPQLSEHRAYGLPDPGLTAAFLDAQGLRHCFVPSGNLHGWLAMMLARHTRPFAYDHDYIEQIDSYYTLHLQQAERCEPAYRHLVMVEKHGAWLDAACASLQDTGRAAGDGWAQVGAWLLHAAQFRQAAEQRRLTDEQARRIHALEQELAWTQSLLDEQRSRAAWLETLVTRSRTEIERINNSRVMRMMRRLRRL